jgi:hypothetical protein
MKGKLEDGTSVDIEKPGAIEQDGKWWEPTEYRLPQIGEYFIYPNGRLEVASIVFTCTFSWIASEIPRATPEQLRAIGMHEANGGRPVICKIGDVIWSRSNYLKTVCTCIDCENEIGRYRFVLVPDVQKEVAGDGYRLLGPDEIIQECDEYKNHDDEWSPAGSITQTVKSQYPLVYRRKIQPAQPEEPCNDCAVCMDKLAQDIGYYLSDYAVRDVIHTEKFIRNWKPRAEGKPEEPRFSVGEIKNWIDDCTMKYMSAYLGSIISSPSHGIKAFTERRRG